MRPALKNPEILPVDLSLFKEQVSKGLGGLFPFKSLDLFHAADSRELKGLLARIGLSERQQERALNMILNGDPFWDRISNQALVPMAGTQGQGTFLCRIFGMPKSIGAEEGAWFLGLSKKVIGNIFFRAKEDSLFSEKKGIPSYLQQIIEGENCPLHILELSFYRAFFPDLNTLKGQLERLFRAPGLFFCGFCEASFWFGIKDGEEKQLEAGLRRALAHFRRQGVPLKRFLAYSFISDREDLIGFRDFSKGFKAAVFASHQVRDLLSETGLDYKDFFRISRIKSPSSSVGLMLRLGSQAKRDAALSMLKDCHFKTGLGERCLFACLKASSLKTSRQGLEIGEYCERLFSSIKRAVDKEATGGFAGVIQPFVTRGNLAVSTFLALYHAHLLGPGNWALFDHVTCNVHGDILFSWGDISGAMVSFRRGLRLKEDDVNLLNSLGACLADVSRFSKAKALFQRVLEVEPGNVMALYNLSSIYLKQNRPKEAKEMAKRAYEQNPSDIALTKRLLELHISDEEWADAYKLSRRIFESGCRCTPGVFKLCARAAMEMGRWQEARELLRNCLEKGQEDQEAILLLAKGFLDFDRDVETARHLLARFKEEDIPKGPLKRMASGLWERIGK